ncbi:MAG TPA: MFS transporter [Chloroflexota bacterium]|nr:MFS transporter [Chloroflexota bacterium]
MTAIALSRSIGAAEWRALAASWLGWMFDGYETYALVLVAGIATRQLIAADQVAQLPIYVGGLLCVTLLGWATGGVLAGILADYVGRKRMLMYSILWYAAFTGLTALAPNYWVLLGMRFLTGLGLGAEWGPGTAMVAEFWPPAVRGRAAAVLQSAFGFGFLAASAAWFLIGPLGAGAWRYMFLLGVLPALLLLYIRTQVQEPALWVTAAERRQAARERAARGQALDAAEHGLLRFTMAQVLAVPVLRRRLFLLVLMSLSTNVGWWATSTWIPQYAAQLAGGASLDAAQWATYTALTYNLGAIVGFLALGTVADLWGRKPATFLFFLGSVVIVELLFLGVHEPRLLLFAAAVNGFFTSGLFTWMPIYTPEVFPTYVRGSAISMVFDSSRYVAAWGPLLAGWLITALGGIGTAAAIVGLIYVLGLVITPWAGPETRGQPLPE